MSILDDLDEDKGPGEVEAAGPAPRSKKKPA
jgi:hypothetical protein